MAKQSKKIKAKITLRVAPLFLIFSRSTTDEHFHLFDITYVLTHIIKPVYKFDLPSLPRVTLSVFRHLTHLADAFQSLFIQKQVTFRAVYRTPRRLIPALI